MEEHFKIETNNWKVGSNDYKIRNSLNVFIKILSDFPKVDVRWAIDTALELADIRPLRDKSAYSNFSSCAIRYLMQRSNDESRK